MKTQRVALTLTAINLILLAILLFRLRPAVSEQGIAPVLRGHSLEIVDDHGKVRAQLLVTTAVTMDGKYYPDGALLRLIDPNGRPVVKLGGSVDGSGMSMAGDSEHREWSGIQLLAEGSGNVVKLTNKDGRQETIAPK